MSEVEESLDRASKDVHAAITEAIIAASHHHHHLVISGQVLDMASRWFPGIWQGYSDPKIVVGGRNSISLLVSIIDGFRWFTCQISSGNVELIVWTEPTLIPLEEVRE